MFVRQKQFMRSSAVAVIALVVQLMAPFAIGTARAVPFAYALVQIDRVKASTATTGTICANFSAGNASAGTETTIRMTWPTGYSVSTTASNWAVATTPTTDWPTGAVAWTGIAQPTNAPSGQVVDFVSGDIASANIYCFNFTNSAALTTATASTNQQYTLASRSGAYPGTADTLSTNGALATIANDQVTINNTTVPPIFSMTLSGTTDGFASNTLSTLNTITSTTGNNVVVSTNAAQGWSVFARDANACTGGAGTTCNSGGKGSLRSITANYYLTTPDPNTLGSNSHTYSGSGEDYGLAATISAGVGTASAQYDGASTKLGTLDPVNHRAISSGTAATASTTTTVVFRAAIATATPAATDYSDVITIVGSGKF